MNPRDFLGTAAVGLVVVVGAFALVDSVRGCDTSETAAPRAPATTESEARTTTSTGPLPQGEAPEGWPQGDLSGVLTFVDSDICQLRAIGLGGGRERPLPDYEIGCGEEVWAPKIGGRVAFRERGPATPERFSVTIRDVGYGDRDFGTYEGSDPVWSPDGQRVAWCRAAGLGVEREILGGADRPLRWCPIAYTPEGNLVHATERRLFVGASELLRASGLIRNVQFGTDGSVVVLTADGVLERHAHGEEPTSVHLPGTWTGRPPGISPDGCAAAAPVDLGIRILSLGCFAGVEQEFQGTAAAWSPDGTWLAVADRDAITFHNVTNGQTAVWPAHATQLLWRPS